MTSWLNDMNMIIHNESLKGLVLLCGIKVTPEGPVTPEHTRDYFHIPHLNNIESSSYPIVHHFKL